MDAKLILDAKATLGEGAMRHTRQDMQADEISRLWQREWIAEDNDDGAGS